MLTRVLEPEVMDTAAEARDYDAMDHRAVNARFCEDLFEHAPVGTTFLDIGTGTARIPILLCGMDHDVRIVAIDLADHMLTLARHNVAVAGLAARMDLENVDAKRMPFGDGTFSCVLSNTILHHIPEPLAVLREALRVTAPGGLIFLRDLVRPDSKEEIDRLVSLHAGSPPDDPSARASFENQRELLRASLHAGLTVEEILVLARQAGMTGATVERTSDRHWTLVFRKP